MAINYSEKLKNLSLKNFYGDLYNTENKNCLTNKLLEIFKNLKIGLVNLKNKFIKIFYKNRTIEICNFDLNNKNSYEIVKKNLTKNGFCFYENFLSDNSYDFLLKNWPHKSFFFEPDTPIKNYKFGFRYIENNLNLNYENPVISQFYNFILSDKFIDYVNFITNSSEKKYKCLSIVASEANQSSYLIPHVDTVADDKNVNEIINIIFFVDGSNDPINSGGTGIYEDNEFEKPMLIPKTLKNSVLIYNSKIKFYHGFNFMKKNSFRKAISFQFLKRN